MKPPKNFTPEQTFYFEHAGYNYKPTESPRAGRVSCAIALAEAVEYADAQGWQFEWDWDESPDLSWMTAEELTQEHEVLCCCVFDPKERETSRYASLAALGGIVDADRNYRKVVQAELALEAMHEHIEHSKNLAAAVQAMN